MVSSQRLIHKRVQFSFNRWREKRKMGSCVGNTAGCRPLHIPRKTSVEWPLFVTNVLFVWFVCSKPSRHWSVLIFHYHYRYLCDCECKLGPKCVISEFSSFSTYSWEVQRGSYYCVFAWVAFFSGNKLHWKFSTCSGSRWFCYRFYWLPQECSLCRER